MARKSVDIFAFSAIISSCFYYEATIPPSSCFFLRQPRSTIKKNEIFVERRYSILIRGSITQIVGQKLEKNSIKRPRLSQ